MLKAIGPLQLALAPLFVVPAMTGQDDAATSLQSQLDATVSSIEYLTGLRANAEAGAPGSVDAILSATQPPASTAPERATRATKIQNDIARLRFEIDKLLSDPSHVAAITSLPPGVVRALGFGGAAPITPEPQLGPQSGPQSGIQSGGVPAGPATISSGVPFAGRSAGPVQGTPAVAEPGTAVGVPNVLEVLPDAPAAMRPTDLRGLEATTGLDDAMRKAMRSDLGPLDNVAGDSRRRGNEPVAIESPGFVADPARLGKLLVRADRPAEAVEVLKDETTPAARYWLGRAFQGLGRFEEAIEIFAELKEDKSAGVHARYASQDLDFLEFRASFERARAGNRSR